MFSHIRLNMRIWRNGRRTRHNAPFSQFAIRKYRPFGDYSLSPFRHASHGDPDLPPLRTSANGDLG